ncbi:tyrosine-type recombinase/integrase [Aquisalimonas lutea]|uniref:tyrosine-type recombinase/integrase n=1 Tax=Aquisalimonas lutea TaxID=1327750 RepID=UPI0025B4A560|nr:site-specific integrase [Aquisalimonas lutea]MDN3518067.1 tyrosine-type recombinase/integrase [Aquisalimonas lutea]
MLTVKQLDNLKPKGSPYRVWDSDRSGFGAQVSKAGVVTFFQFYRMEGKRRFMNLGRYPDKSLRDAREEAAEARNLVQQGVDPQDKREADREAEKAEKRRRDAEPLVSDAVATYIRKHVSGLASEKPITRYFERDLVPELGELKVKDVRRRDVLNMVEKKAAQTPTAARHLLAYTKGFFDWCVDREYIDASPAAGIKPKSVKAEGKKNALRPGKRARVLDAGETRTFWNEVEGCGVRRLTALALKLVLVTGQRPGEVAGIHKDEIDGDVWTIPAERRLKTESEHVVPLAPLALELIEQAQQEVQRLQARRSDKATGYIFEAYPGSALTVGALSKAVTRYAEALGNQDDTKWGHWTPHDLRRTCRTGLSEMDIPDEIGEAVIGHVKLGMVGVYNQNKYVNRKREALEAWERRLLRLAVGEEATKDNVVSLH